MKIVISSGHGKYIRGASGSPVPPQLDEVDEARKVVDQVAVVLKSMGVDVTTFHDNTSHDQNTNLNTIVNFHNSQGAHDLDVSVHFNAYGGGANGHEVDYLTQKSLSQRIAGKVCTASGLKKRGENGAVYRDGLKFLNATKEPAVLIETCFCDYTPDCDKYRAHFSAICTAIAEGLTGEESGVVPGPNPEPEPEPTPPPFTDRSTIGKGDDGEDVIALQKSLGVLIPDGDFGSITETWVKAFQAACGLKADGVVGPLTWEEVDDLDVRLRLGELPLPKALADQIYTMAQTSEIADYSWPGRGVPPPGYIAGMALSFAVAFSRAAGEDDAADVMSKSLGDDDVDALAWYKSELTKNGLSLASPEDRLRSLFVMMIGLGPRESSGKYCEGRDMSASNVASDTCEAGLFQTSWNIRNGDSAIGPLLDEFWDNPNGFLLLFKEEVSPTSNNLNSYGSGDGVRYQFLSRFCPLFHVMVTAVGMRVLRQHWGPINRREVTIKKEADDLLRAVQELVEGYS